MAMKMVNEDEQILVKVKRDRSSHSRNEEWSCQSGNEMMNEDEKEQAVVKVNEE